MQKLHDPLDLLVVGNEPAGLWLLREFSKLYPEEAALKKWEKKQPTVGWLKTQEPIQDFPMLKSVATEFGIEPRNCFSAEIVSSRNLFRWDLDQILNRFPNLKELFQDKVLNPSDRTSLPLLANSPLGSPLTGNIKKSIDRVLTLYPEILVFSQALWKQLGRSRKITPQMMVWAALQATELFSWSSEHLIPSINNLEILSPNESEKWVSIEQIPSTLPNSKGKLFKLTFTSGAHLLTKSLVHNLSIREIKSLPEENDIASWIPLPEDILSRFSHYPLRLEFDHFRLPRNVQPLTIFLDENVLPEPDLEMWPMTQTQTDSIQKITLWATDRTEFSLEGITECFGHALNRFQRHFPTALRKLKTQSVSLGMETCFNEEQRIAAIKEIESSAKELYSVSLLHVRTRQKGLFSLLPALRCDLPYPLGPLSGAREVLRDLFSRKTLQKSPEVSQSSQSPSPTL